MELCMTFPEIWMKIVKPNILTYCTKVQIHL